MLVKGATEYQQSCYPLVIPEYSGFSTVGWYTIDELKRMWNSYNKSNILFDLHGGVEYIECVLTKPMILLT